MFHVKERGREINEILEKQMFVTCVPLSACVWGRRGGGLFCVV